MLEITDLRAGYGRVEILHSLSMRVAQGSITALVGANGAGKSTLMRAVLGIVPASAGRITFDGRRLEQLPSFERIRCGVALSPEGRLVFPNMSVMENLRLGAISSAPGRLDVPLEKVLTLFPKLKDRLSQPAGSLSGGEQQMLAVGRALMSTPRLLLLDEPTLGLAPVMADKIFESMDVLRKEGLTILMAEQDTQRTLEIADTAYVVQNGRVVMEGAGVELIDDETVQKAFLGI